MLKRLKTAIAALALSLTVSASDAADKLSVEIYNPQGKSLFPVTSVLITGPREAILVDAQFQTNDAAELVKMVQKSGKKLTTLYISHKDPDFYFGAEVIKAAFPDVKILASPSTVAGIQANHQGKLAHWGPILAENAPKSVLIPQALSGDTLKLDGEEIKIVGLKGHDPKHSFVHIPSLKTAYGSINVFSGMHVWMADTQTKDSRAKWLKTLDSIDATGATKIIPGHWVGEISFSAEDVAFTRKYVQTIEEKLAQAQNSAELIAEMNKAYPGLPAETILELGAKVLTGEMAWK